MKQVREAYGKYFSEMEKLSHAPAVIDETNIYQEANLELSKYMDMMLNEAFLPKSHIANLGAFKQFYNDCVKDGKKGIIFMEHYTNLDLPGILYLLRKTREKWAIDLASRIVAIAGLKLNEASPFVRIWTEGFSRVVIYPTRSLLKITNEEERKAEEARARKINFASMRAMDKLHKEGKVILVFPSGTRYRPGVPDTKRGLREIDSYVRLFDEMLLVAINGMALTINPDTPEDMLSDYLSPDTVVLSGAGPIDCKSFRRQIIEDVEKDVDEKQIVVDVIMQMLDAEHRMAGE